MTHDTADTTRVETTAPESPTTGERRRGLFRARSRLGKVISAVVVLWAAASVTFILQSLAPGNRATLLLNLASGESRERTPDEIAPVNAQYGFTDPIWRQYLDYLGGLVRGDLGTSYQLQQPVLRVIGDQIGPTLVLTAGALILAWLIVIVVTVGTAGRRGPLGAIGSLVETVTAGLPHYWLGAILLVVFAINLGWFPVESGDGLPGLVLPVLTLAVPPGRFPRTGHPRRVRPVTGSAVRALRPCPRGR